MPLRVEHSASHAEPAKLVYSVLVDANYLRERLKFLGGRDAELTSHEVTDRGATYRIRHGLDARNLPGVVRMLISGDLVIDRTETWELGENGNYRGHSTVTIPKTSAEITATLRLADTEAGSELSTNGQVEVAIPFVGGQVEEIIARNVRKLLDSEHEFARRWLAEHG